MILVAVTEVEYGKSRDTFERARADGLYCLCAPAGEQALAAFLRAHGATCAVVGDQPYRNALYEAIPRGGVIARFGVGFDGLDVARATRHGVLCTNTPGAVDESVAEQTVALMLAAARHLCESDRRVRGGAWQPRAGTELAGKRLAIIGCGRIGCAVARIAAQGLGMRVSGCDECTAEADPAWRRQGFERVERDFAAAVAEADFVSLHIPSSAATRHFLNAERLQAVRRGAWLINTARGAVVDEEALYDALVTGRLAGAALDVTEQEPYAPLSAGRDLRLLPNVIMTPHEAGFTAEACARAARRALDNIARAARHDFAALDLLNPEALPPGR